MISLKEQNNIIDTRESNHLYLNISIKPNDNESVREASFSETFTQEFLSKGLDYTLSVVRFRIPISGIPYFFFKIQEGLSQTDPDLGIYAFTLTHVPSGDDFTTYVKFDTNDFSVPVPKPPSENNGFQNLNTRYYNVYDVPAWIYMLNTALTSSFANLKAAYPGIPETEPPSFIYNEDNLNISLIVPYNYFTGNIEIFFNEELQAFFDGYTYNLYDDSLKFGQFQIYTKPFGSSLIINGYSSYGVSPTNPPAYLEMKSSYSPIEKWAGLRSFVIKTSLLPIRYENSNTNDNRGDLSDDTILTDFNITGYIGNRVDVSFFPQGPYRLIDLLSNNPLRNIDLQIFWKDRTGFLRKLFIYKGDELTLKLAFITKGLSN